MKTLKTILELNWRSVREGQMGAINSVYSNAKSDLGNMQAEEFWVAVNYGLGSLLIAHVRLSSVITILYFHKPYSPFISFIGNARGGF